MYVGIVKYKDKITNLYTSNDTHLIIEYFKNKVTNFKIDNGYQCTGNENIYGRFVKLNIYLSEQLKNKI